MLEDIRKLDIKLSDTFKKVLATALCMLFIAIIGGVIALFLSYNVGHIIVLIAVVIGNISLVSCLVLKVLGKHLKKE